MKKNKFITMGVCAAVLANIVTAPAIALAETTTEKPVNTTEKIKDKTAVEAPVAKAPLAEKPVIETPVIETPAADAPVAEKPVIETPIIEAPVAEAPLAEKPVIETPVADAPVVEKPIDDNKDKEIEQIPGINNGLEAPILSIAPKKAIKKGSKFNPLEGVFAYHNGKDISSTVTYTSNVDVNKVTPNITNAVPYKVNYSVSIKTPTGETKTTTGSTEIYVFDEKEIGMYSASIANFTIAQNGDINDEIAKRIVVKKPNGKIASPSEYSITTNGSAGGGNAGKFNISIVVYSKEYNTYTETTVTVTVVKGVSLNAPDKKIFVGDKFDPLEGVTAFEINADGSKQPLGAYDYTANTPDVGIAYTSEVNTLVAGVYPVTYTAKNSKGVTETKVANVTVAERNFSITASDVTIMEGETFVPSKYATAHDDKDGNVAVTTSFNNVNSKVIGTYQVTYEAVNSAGTAATSKQINVNVVKREATITVNSANVEVFQGQKITEALIKSWATASDPVDGDLSGKLTYTITEGAIETSVVGTTYHVTYSVTNSAGNTTTADLTVTVKDRHATITAANQTVNIGDVVTDAMILAWATASDPVDGDNLPVTNYKVLDGPINTMIPGSTYTIEYSYDNTAGNTATATITLKVADLIAPTLNAENQEMFVGEKLTEDMILAWAKAENATYVSFEVQGSPIKVKNSDNTLVEAGVHKIKFTAINEVSPKNTRALKEKKVEKTITLTVKNKATDDQGSKKQDKQSTSNNNKKKTPTKEIKSSKQNLPKTGAQENSLMATLTGMLMIAFYSVFKKRKHGSDLD